MNTQAATNDSLYDPPLVPVLIADLCEGHFTVAIRHFLMLKGCGATLPALVERSCEELLAACPAGRRTKIARDADAWLAMRRRPAQPEPRAA